MENITYKMARFTKELKYEDLSPESIDLCKRFLLDSVGCAYGGSQTEDVKIMLDLFNDMGGKEEATVLNSDQKLPMVNAGLLNSLMIRALDLLLVKYVLVVIHCSRLMIFLKKSPRFLMLQMYPFRKLTVLICSILEFFRI